MSDPRPEPDPVTGTERAAEPAQAPPREPGRWAFTRYNLARAAMFLVALGVFYLLGFRGLALLLVALLVSGALAFGLLWRLREDAGRSVRASYRRFSARLDARTDAEDEDVEASAAEGVSSEGAADVAAAAAVVADDAAGQHDVADNADRKR